MSTAQWFSAVKKSPVWAKQVTEPCTIKTLEGMVSIEAGSFVCRGLFQDFWAQDKATLTQRYKAVPGEKDVQGWQKYIPIPDQCRVWARQMDQPFTVDVPQGTLSGQKGDYLVKNFTSDISNQRFWIVNKTIFVHSYQKVSEAPDNIKESNNG